MISAKKTNSNVTKMVDIDNVGLGVMSRDKSNNLIFKVAIVNVRWERYPNVISVSGL